MLIVLHAPLAVSLFKQPHLFHMFIVLHPPLADSLFKQPSSIPYVYSAAHASSSQFI